MSATRDWEGIRKDWTSDFDKVLYALVGANNEPVSKQTKRQLKIAIKITEEQKRVVLDVIQTAQEMDKIVHRSEAGAERKSP